MRVHWIDLCEGFHILPRTIWGDLLYHGTETFALRSFIGQIYEHYLLIADEQRYHHWSIIVGYGGNVTTRQDYVGGRV